MVFLPEDLCNRSPCLCALVVQEKTPSPLPVGCQTDGLLELSREHCLMEVLRYGIILFLTAECGPSFAGSIFRLGVPHQAIMLSSLPEVHAPGYPCPDLPGPVDAQRLRKNDMGEDEGSLGVPAS